MLLIPHACQTLQLIDTSKKELAPNFKKNNFRFGKKGVVQMLFSHGRGLGLSQKGGGQKYCSTLGAKSKVGLRPPENSDKIYIYVFENYNAEV